MKFILAALTCVALTAPALGQELIDGSNFDDVVNAARGYGAATLQLDGEYPTVQGRIDGLPYILGFRNCSSDTQCDDFLLQTFYLDPVIDYEAVNGWNRAKRWAKAYVDQDGDIVLEMDVNLTGGISSKNLDEAFYYWSLAINQFSQLFDESGVMTNASAPAADPAPAEDSAPAAE